MSAPALLYLLFENYQLRLSKEIQIIINGVSFAVVNCIYLATVKVYILFNHV